MIRKLKSLLILSLNSPLYFVSKLTTKSSDIWIFGAWFGEQYSGNSKALFEYINKEHPEITAIWLSSNQKLIDHVRSIGYKCYGTYSIKAIALGMRAGFSIFEHSNSTDNMHFLNNGKTKLIQLWHGVPLKKIGLDDNLYTFKKKQSSVKQTLFPFLIERYDLIISCSNEDKKNFMSSFNNENVIITGYPRNDVLFKKISIRDGFNVIYSPTFRDTTGSHIDLFTHNNFDLRKWIKYLNFNNINFYIKMHPVNQLPANIIDAFSREKNIWLVDDYDIAELLPIMDILITDYSSVYFDYLLTNKPIIYSPFDYEAYIINDRKFYYEYSTVTPGPKCKDWNEVLVWLQKFKNDPTLYADKRKLAKNHFHKFQDNKSCERVFNRIAMFKSK